MSRIYPEKPKAVYFFGTCLVDLFYPQAGVAGIELLQREGIKVIFPQAQSCCGQPAFNNGHRKDALAVARLQLGLFPKDIPVVLPSGSCAGMMHKHYPELFEGEADHDQACNLAARVFELTDFLLNVVNIQFEDKGDPLKITWHPSCHSQREMGVREQPKELIKRLKNVEFIELKREKECCGFGGTFAVKQPEISAAMVTDKVDDIEATGAKKLISGDCGCLLNITGHMEHRESTISGQHIAEFLWERTNDSR
jgi:L-lactate dehydrogenase complex protein LldE